MKTDSDRIQAILRALEEGDLDAEVHRAINELDHAALRQLADDLEGEAALISGSADWDALQRGIQTLRAAAQFRIRFPPEESDDC